MSDSGEDEPSTRDSKRQRPTARGKNFTAADDRNLCIAWLAISNDPLKGRPDQLGDAFWREIQDHAKMKKRTCNGVRQRWGLISRCVMKFIECITTVSNQTKSNNGELVDNNVYDDAVELYVRTTNAKKWQFSECYDILHKSQKFTHYHQLKSAAANANHSLLVPHTQSQQLSHPNSYNNESNHIYESYETESNADDTKFFGEFDSTSDPSAHFDENGFGNSFAKPTDTFDPNDSRQVLERRRVEALEALAKAAQRKNELLELYIGAMNAATDAKYVTQSPLNLDALSLQILELKKVKILMTLQQH